MDGLSIQRILLYIFWIYLLALILLTLIPINTFQGDFTGGDLLILNIRGDYWLHALLYIPLPLLMGITIQDRLNGKRYITISRCMKAIIFSIILAVGLETFQLLLSYRTFNPNDLAGNLGGVLIGTVILGVAVIRNNNINRLKGKSC